MDNLLEHVYNFLPTHNERTGCCALPPGVRLDQSDQFTLRGNPYPNINQLSTAAHHTNFNYHPQLQQLYQTHPAIRGRFNALRGVHNTRMFDVDAHDDYGQACCATAPPSMETMSRLWMSNKVMECPQKSAACLDPYTWNLPDNWQRFYH